MISWQGSTGARVQKIDNSLDLALLELTRPISACKARFADFPLEPGLVLLAVGVQATPGQPDALSVAEIKLKCRNQNDADGKILDIQLDGGARPGYSGGPVVVEKGGALLCVGVMRSGGPWASSTNAIGLASIRAFVEDYIPDMSGGKSGAPSERIRRVLIFSAFFFGAVAVGATIGWHYLVSHRPTVTSGGAVVAGHEPDKTGSGRPAPGKNPASSFKGPPPTLAGPDKINKGNSNVKVWVNTSLRSSRYHCPGSRYYGTTEHGEYMTQAEAQKKGTLPAHGKPCE